VHAAQERSGSIGLKAGLHAIAVTFFEAAGGEELTVSWEGPSVAKQAIPGSALRHGGTGGGGDTTKPTVSVTSPTNGAAVYDAVAVEGAASDDVAVDRVEVSIDGGAYSPATGSSHWSYWTYSFDATTLSTGQHTVTARATDASGNAATAAITITVDPSATTEPSITIVTPAGGEIWFVGTTPRIEWTAANLTDVALRYSVDGGAQVEIDGSVDTTEPGWESYPWTVPSEPSTNCVIHVAGYMGECPTDSNAFEIRDVADSDLDGMDDGWEALFFGDLSRDGTADFDSDGLTDYQEFIGATDPAAGGAAAEQGSPGLACRHGPAGPAATPALLFAPAALVAMLGDMLRRKRARPSTQA
jgi:hypothetical protein